MESMYHYNVINYKFIHRDAYFMTAYNEKWDDKLVNNDFFGKNVIVDEDVRRFFVLLTKNLRYMLSW